MSKDVLVRKRELYEWQDLDFAKVSFTSATPFTYRRSVFMATLNNLDVSPVDIYKMMEGGMNLLRLGPEKSNLQVAEVLAKFHTAAKFLAQKYGKNAWPCASCMDIRSRLVTTGLLEDRKVKSIFIKENTKIILSCHKKDSNQCNEQKIYVNNPYLIMDVTIGLEISIAEDTIILEVTEINENTVKCTVTKGGLLGNMASVCMRGAKNSRPYVTKEDLEYVRLALENQVDMIIVNYVRHPKTIIKIKQYIGNQIKRPWIASGICTMEGLCNINEVIRESDILIFSREKLAYELGKEYFSRMVSLQKYVLGKCREAFKPMFLCGQVFESMLLTGNLAYGDVSDVANAILDGVAGFGLEACEDADDFKLVMKSLNDVCTQMEPFTSNIKEFQQVTEGMNVPLNAALTAAMCCVLLANKAQAHAIIIPTVSGRTIYHVNQYHPICPIIAVTTNIRTFRYLEILRSVTGILYEGPPLQTWYETVANRIDRAVEHGLDNGWLNYGDDYVTLEKGFEESTFCDSIRIQKVIIKKHIKLCIDSGDPN